MERDSNNKYLIEIYNQGFNNELVNGNPNPYEKGTVENIAYGLGKSDAYWGDDNPAIDSVTEEQIIEAILVRCKQ